MQMAEGYTLLVQFSNVEVGDFHGDVGCDLRSPIPITYEALQHGTELLQKSFRIVTNISEATSYMEVPPREPSWITNFRKSVVDMLPLTAIWGEIQSTENGFGRPSFGRREDLMGGLCMNWYTVTKMPENVAARVRLQSLSKMEEDVQQEGETSDRMTSAKGRGSASAKGRGRKGSKTSSKTSPKYTDLPSIHDDLWSVSRTVDYDLCDKKVSVKINSNKQTEDLISRTSKGHYVVRGDEQGIRLESALVEGSISVFTSDSHHDRIDTFTNQSLELQAVRITRNELTIDYEAQRIDSWHYEVDTPFNQNNVPGIHQNMELVHIGTQLTDEDVRAIVRTIYVHLTKLASAPANLVVEMDTVAQAISYLSYEHIEEIYTQLKGKAAQADARDSQEEIQATRQEVYDFKLALVVAGTESAIKFFLDKMSDEEIRLEDEAIFFFFKNIATTLKDPSLASKILELVMSMSWETREELATTVALTGGASLASKLCLSPERRDTYEDISCHPKSLCDTRYVVDTFIPYLNEGLQNQSSPEWRRVVYIQALSNLATPLTIRLLQPIILGIDDSSVGLRTTAITSLHSRLLPHSALGTVYNLLMPIIENQGEHPDVRSMAFLTMTSWQPGPGWWKHMAISTWHEPSSQVANIISSSIQAIASSNYDVAKTASQVLYLTKPSTTSFTHSSSIYFSGDFPGHSGIIWLANTKGLLPSHIFLAIQGLRIHGFTSEFKMSLYQDTMDFFITIIQMYEEQFRKGDIPSFSDASRLLQELTFNLIEELDIPLTGFPTEAKFFLTSNRISDIATKLEFFGGGRIFRFIRVVQRYFPQMIDSLRYGKGIDTTIAYPTDLGVPFIVQYSAQSALKLTKNTEEVPKPLDFPSTRRISSLKFSLQASEEASISTKTLVPWLKSGVGAGIRRESNVKLPIIFQGALYTRSKQVMLRLQSSENKVQLIKAANEPFTVLYKGATTLRTVSENEFKLVNRYDVKPFTWQRQVAPWSGINLKSSWNGDCDFPFISLLSGDYKFLLPGHNKWEYSLNYDLEASETRSIATILTYASAVKKSQADTSNAGMDSMSQESQSGSDYSDYSQFSQSSSQDYSQFPSSSDGFQEELGEISQVHQRRNLEEIAQRITQFQDQVPHGQITSFGVDIDLEGTTTFSYEAMVMYVKETTQKRSKLSLKLKLQSNIPEGILAEPQEICFDFDMEKPNFLPLSTSEDVLTTDFLSTLKSELHMGTTCSEHSLLEIQGEIDVTEVQKANVRKKLENGCEYNTDKPQMDIITSQLYDQAKLMLQWTESFPESWMNITYHVSDVVRGLICSKIASDYTAKNTKNKVSIDAFKNLKTNFWEARIHKPSEETVYHVTVPSFIGIPASLEDVFTHRVMNGRSPSICVIGDTKVRTFDGVEFVYTPRNCWNVVAMECEQAKFLYQVRFTDQWEAKILWKDEGLMFDITSSNILVNGETDVGSNDNYDVYHLEDALLLTMRNGMAVKVSNKVEIYTTFVLRDQLCGLCGNYNGEKSSDMTGPKGCVYADPELYASAWEAAGDGCNAFAQRGRKQKTRSFQENCLKNEHIPTGISHENTHSQCMRWQYQERTEGRYKCRAIVPTPVCNSECVSTSTSSKPITYDCILEEDQEENVKCYQHSYKTTFSDGCIELRDSFDL